MNRQRPKQITIQVKGSLKDSGNVRLDEFLGQLGNIRNALRETERTITNSEPILYYRIIGLSHQSPATIIIEPTSDSPDYSDDRLASIVAGSFSANLRYISRKRRAPRTANVSVLETYRDIVAESHKHITEVVIRVGHHSAVINEKFKEAIEEALGVEESSYGSISGRLEAISLHTTLRFAIYPSIGPSKITGTFKKQLREKFAGAVDKYVTVYGLLKYKTWDRFPHHIIAHEVDVHTRGASLLEMRGMAPGATGDLTSVEFLDRLRNEDEHP